MDSDDELDIVEQAERTAMQDANAESDENDGFQEVAREPDADENMEVEADGNEDDEDTARKVIKPKRLVRNPQPKLNADTLRGPRGLTALPALFAKQKFKGRGHEATDLNVLLKTYEYWCHRLFPKMRFEQCIERIEALGSKKQVMTYVKRIRMGILDDPPVVTNENVISDEEVESTPQQQQQIENIESRFDRLAQQQPRETAELTTEQRDIINANKERAKKLRADRLWRIREQAQAALGESELLHSQTIVGEVAPIENSIDDSMSMNVIESETTAVVQNSMDLFSNSEIVTTPNNQITDNIIGANEQIEDEVHIDDMLNNLQNSECTLNRPEALVTGIENCSANETHIDVDDMLKNLDDNKC